MGFAVPDSRLSYPTGAETMAWSGAITPSSFRVNADVLQTCGDVRLLVSANSDMSSPVFTSAYQTPTLSIGSLLSHRTVSFDVTGLSANTTYYYKFDFKDAPNNGGLTRSVNTAPTANSAASFRFVVGSCSNVVGMHGDDAIFHSIALDAPLFFMHIGDMTYADIGTTAIGRQRDEISRAYRSFPHVDFCNRTVPIVYMFDDHDAGPNDVSLDTTNAETIMRNARAVTRETVPIYPTVQTALGETDITKNLLTQVFDIGRCRFIIPDCRSQRRVSTLKALGSASGSGDYWDQLSWLATALAQAETDGIAQIFLVITSTWTGGTYSGYGDVFTAERTAICDLIEGLNTPVCLLTGDCHECAADDGTNTGFSTSGFAFFPQVIASCLVQPNALSGAGPFSWNGGSKRYNTVNSMYCVMDVADSGAVSWTATFKGKPIDPSTFAPSTLGSVVSTDATPAVSFNNTAPSVAHNVALTVNLDKTWFGACSVHWASSDGQSGNVTFLPNKKRASFSVTFVSAGSPTITLSSPTGCTISGTNPITVTVT